MHNVWLGTLRRPSAANGILVCVAHLKELPAERMLAVLSAPERYGPRASGTMRPGASSC